MFRFIVLILIMISRCCCDSILLTKFQSSLHNRDCYTQGLFFLNQTHIFESCGLYNKSFFHILQYQASENSFSIQQVYRSDYPIDDRVFLQGATYFSKTNKIYLLTWRQGKVYELNADTFETQKVLKWKKDGWGLTNNKTHMFITDGSPNIYLVDQKMNIIQQKTIYNKNGNKLYNINELELVKQSNGKQYIYANIYMQRKIVKINFQTGEVVKEIDGLKIIQNQKGIKYDQVINGIASIPYTGEFIITGKNWAHFYKVQL